MLPEKTNLQDRDLGRSVAPLIDLLTDQQKSGELFAKLVVAADNLKTRLGADSYRQIAKQVSLRDELRSVAVSI
jgi:hypothetical protein